MKAVICDGCGVQAKPQDAYGTAPIGWVNLQVCSAPYEGPKDFCSKRCALQALMPLPVSDVERTIEDAERAGLSAASLV
jgi:hypothetical protein